MFRLNESITAGKFFKDVSQNVNPKFKTKLSQHKEGDAKVFSYVDDTDEDLPYIEYKVFYLENGGFAPVRFAICANDLALGRKYEKKLLSILDDEGLDTSLYSRKETKFDKSITLEYKGRNLDAVKIKPTEKKNINKNLRESAEISRKDYIKFFQKLCNDAIGSKFEFSKVERADDCVRYIFDRDGGAGIDAVYFDVYQDPKRTLAGIFAKFHGNNPAGRKHFITTNMAQLVYFDDYNFKAYSYDIEKGETDDGYPYFEHFIELNNLKDGLPIGIIIRDMI